MNSGPLRALEIYGDPSDFGRIHGTECKAMVRGYLDERLGLSGDASWAGRSAAADTVLALAEQTLPYHRDYSPTLFDEMLARRRPGSRPAEAVVVGDSPTSSTWSGHTMDGRRSRTIARPSSIR